MTIPREQLASGALSLDCQSVHHWFGAKHVLHDVNITLLRGQFLSLVGPSGCGKSTLLRGVVGTHVPSRGKLLLYPQRTRFEGVEIRGPGRDRGIVYQQYSLFPFMTAAENVAAGLMLDQTSIPFRFFCYPKWRRVRKAHLAEASEFLAKLNLADAVNLYPHEMSGGMRQRVAIAQALIMKPEIILLDEPFGALDEATRESLQELLLALYEENKKAKARGEHPPYTLVIVTHELNEAIYVGDRVVGLSQYWNWRDEGHSQCPGATVLYDKAAPVFKPESGKDYEFFAEQRDEIRHAVFDPQQPRRRGEFVNYWQQFADGKAGGLFS